MRRPLKFALTMKEGVSVRDLDELRLAFDPSATWDYFQSGRLALWLEQRQYLDELAKLSEFGVDSPEETVASIADVLGVQQWDRDWKLGTRQTALDGNSVSKGGDVQAKVMAPVAVGADSKTVSEGTDLVCNAVEPQMPHSDIDEAVYLGGYARHGVFQAEGAPVHPEVTWTFESRGGEIGTTPVVWQDTVLVVDDAEGIDERYLYALDIETGAPKWTYPIINSTGSAPAVSSRMVYLPLEQDLVALDVDNGQVLWKQHLNGFMYDTSPVVDGELVYVCTEPVGYHSGCVEAFRAKTGETVWKFELRHNTQHRFPLVLADGKVYVVDHEINLARRGFGIRPERLFGSEETKREDRETPGSTHHLYALDGKTGSVLWSVNINRNLSYFPTASGGFVYVVSNQGFVYGYNAETGELVDSWDFGSHARSTPIVMDDVMYLATTEGVSAQHMTIHESVWSFEEEDMSGLMSIASDVLYYLLADGAIQAVRVADGEGLWRCQPRGEADIAKLHAPTIYKDMVFYSAGSRLYVLR